MCRGGTSQVRCNSRIRTHSGHKANYVPRIETAEVATEAEECDWMPDGLMDFDRELQAELDDCNNINAKCDERLESIKENHNEDGANELSEEELQQAVLNGNVQTATADAGASVSCGKPSVSD